MDKFKNKIQDFMRTRNGMDELGKVIGIVTIILSLFGMVLKNRIVADLGLFALIYFLFRFFSPGNIARQDENRKFLDRINLCKLQYEQRKEYRIFKCKSCGRNIRVPKGKGKIEVTCPLCGTKKICRT